MENYNDRIVRLLSDVDVYSTKDGVLFRRGTQSLFLETKREFDEIKCMTNDIRNGLSVLKLAKALDIEEVDSQAIIDEFLRCQLACTRNIDPEHAVTQEMIDSLIGLNVPMPATTLQQTINDMTINYAGPKMLWNSLQTTLQGLGMASQEMSRNIGDDHIMKVQAKDTLDPSNSLMVLYLADLDGRYIRETAMQIAASKIPYIPITFDGGLWVVGPVVDNDGPCIACFDHRNKAIMVQPEVPRMIYNSDSKVVSRGEPQLSPVHTSLISSVVASLSLKYLIGADRGFGSRVRTVYYLSPMIPAVTTGVLYKSPDCEVCSPRQDIPDTYAFMTSTDSRLIAEESMDKMNCYSNQKVE